MILISIKGNFEIEFIFGESNSGKWLIVSEEKEIASHPYHKFFLKGWKLYRISKNLIETSNYYR